MYISFNIQNSHQKNEKCPIIPKNYQRPEKNTHPYKCI